MRLMWQSNAPWVGTGYGQQTKLLLHELKEDHEVHCFAFYGLTGGRISYDGYTVWPVSDFHAWGDDVVAAHLEQSKAEVIITLLDIFVLDPEVWKKLNVPWVAWLPVDSDTIGHPTLERLKLVNYPIAMSYHGETQMMAEGIEPLAVIYHCVDTDVFQPLDKWECRRELGFGEDEYIVGMVMANKGDRKQYPAQLQAIKNWKDTHPDYNIKVFMHTDPTDKMGGWDMKSLVAKLGLKDQVYTTTQYFTSVVAAEPDTMAKFYNSMDVLMNCSAGEGFGIPIIEAQACGTPVITHGVTSMPELTHNGYTVKSDVRSLSAHYGFQYGPSIADMEYRLECAYRAGKGNWQEGRQWVIDNCSVPVIAEQWKSVLKLVQG